MQFPDEIWGEIMSYFGLNPTSIEVHCKKRGVFSNNVSDLDRLQLVGSCFCVTSEAHFVSKLRASRYLAVWKVKAVFELEKNEYSVHFTGLENKTGNNEYGECFIAIGFGMPRW